MAAPTILQKATATGGGASIDVTLTDFDVTAGHSLVVSFITWQGTGGPGISDTLDTPYELVDGTISSPTTSTAWMLTGIVPVSGACTVSLALSAGLFISACVMELDQAVEVNQFAARTQASEDTPSPGLAATTRADALVIGVVTYDETDLNPAAASGWTTVASIDPTNTVDECCVVISKTMATAGAADPTWDALGPGTFTSVGAAFVPIIPTGGWCERGTTGTTATGTTSLTITKPSGTVDGDILICSLAHKGSDWAVMPGGWTVVDRVLQGSTRTEMHWKRASGEGASYSITGLATVAGGCMRAYGGGREAGTVVNISSSATAAAGTSAIAPTMTADFSRSLLVAAIGSGANDPLSRCQFYTAPLAVLPPTDLNIRSLSIRANARTTGISCGLADVQKAVAGETGTCKATLVFGALSGENGIIVAALIPEPQATLSGTRYYLAAKYPSTRVEGVPHGGWDATWQSPTSTSPYLTPYRLSQTRSDAGRASEIRMVTNVPESDTLVYYGITPPLAAQTIAGTIDVCALCQQAFEDRNLGPIAVEAVYKLHVYIAQGESTTVRHTLLDQYVDTNLIAFNVLTGTTLDSPQTLDSGAALDGDCVVVELGFHVGDFATPTPLRPPEDYARVDLVWATQDNSGFSVADALRAFGPAFPDVGGGETPGSAIRGAYIDFSQALIEQVADPNTAPNQTLLTASVIPTLPFASSAVSTINLEQPLAPLWWAWEADYTGRACAHVFGSAYPVTLAVWRNDSGTLATIVRASSSGAMGGAGLAQTAVMFECESGTTYYVRAYQTVTSAAPSCGGALVVNLFAYSAPAEGDLLLPVANYGIARYRGDTLVDLWFSELLWTGIAIDYTQRPLVSVTTGDTNTDVRLYVGIYPRGPVEILDLTTYEEIDYISHPLPTVSLGNWEDGKLFSQAQLAMTPTGMLHVAWWGNGFTRVAGSQSATDLQGSYLLTTATTNSSQLAVIDGAHADSQPGAPWPLAARYSLAQPTAGAGYLAVDDAGSVVTYTSGGIYIPTDAHVVQQFSASTDTQLPDLATLPDSGTAQSDVKGLCAIPSGGWLVCNGDRVLRLDANGIIVQAYVPDVPAWAISLVDVRLTPDAAAFWTIDLGSMALFKFDLTTGDQLEGFRTFLGTGNVTQMAIYGELAPVPPPPSPTYQTRTLLTRRLRQSPHLSKLQQWLRYDRFQIDLQTGIGTPTGQGEDPQLMLQWSDDGGHTWSNEHWVSAGKMGARRTRAIWRQLGRARTRTFRVVVSDPNAWFLAAAYLDVKDGAQE